MSTPIAFPAPQQIQHRTDLCRAELAELKRALRAARAVQRAEEVRRAREQVLAREVSYAPR